MKTKTTNRSHLERAKDNQNAKGRNRHGSRYVNKTSKTNAPQMTSRDPVGHSTKC